jgi:hypothetical protein
MSNSVLEKTPSYQIDNVGRYRLMQGLISCDFDLSAEAFGRPQRNHVISNFQPNDFWGNRQEATAFGPDQSCSSGVASHLPIPLPRWPSINGYFTRSIKSHSWRKVSRILLQKVTVQLFDGLVASAMNMHQAFGIFRVCQFCVNRLCIVLICDAVWNGRSGLTI